MNTNSGLERKINNRPNVYTIIGGIPISLPYDAKYVCQDKRGCWFYCARRPRVKDDDWTPNKHPIQLQTPTGRLKIQVLKTDITDSWQSSLQTTIKKSHLPIHH